MSDDKDNDAVLRFFGSIHALKNLVRRGWDIRGIDNAESVAEHTFGVAILAMILGIKMNRDVGRCVMMALVHDIGEAIIGDIAPSDGVSALEKQSQERDAARQILDAVDDDGLLLGLWEEYAAASSEDACFIKELDKLEMAFQAYFYEREREVCLDDFFPYAADRINSHELSAIFGALLKSRQSELP